MARVVTLRFERRASSERRRRQRPLGGRFARLMPERAGGPCTTPEHVQGRMVASPPPTLYRAHSPARHFQPDAASPTPSLLFNTPYVPRNTSQRPARLRSALQAAGAAAGRGLHASGGAPARPSLFEPLQAALPATGESGRAGCGDCGAGAAGAVAAHARRRWRGATNPPAILTRLHLSLSPPHSPCSSSSSSRPARTP